VFVALVLLMTGKPARWLGTPPDAPAAPGGWGFGTGTGDDRPPEAAPGKEPPVAAAPDALGPLEPSAHAGESRTLAGEAGARLVRDDHKAYRMKRDVEFIAWGPHDLKGETANVLKDDDRAVYRVRYRYQREGQPAVEKDKLVTLDVSWARRHSLQGAVP